MTLRKNLPLLARLPPFQLRMLRVTCFVHEEEQPVLA
jgi:hypothetical protein